MREEDLSEWVDHRGIKRKTPTIKGRLKFKIATHAALRAYVFFRDGFRCVKCGKQATPPANVYDGREAVLCPDGVCLVMDHSLSRRRGGSHHPSNLVTMCEGCNSTKACLEEGAGGSRG